MEGVSGDAGVMIYSGSKFFWRTRDDIEILIYMHVKARALEVIPFHIAKNKELERNYLSIPILLKTIGNDAIQKKIEELTAKRGQGDALATPAAKKEEAKRLALSAHVLARLQTSINGLVFEPSGSDDRTLNPVLTAPVPQLVPASVIRRRKTTSQEVSSTMESLAAAQRALLEATGEAAKVANFQLEHSSSTPGVAMQPRKQSATSSSITSATNADTTKNL